MKTGTADINASLDWKAWSWKDFLVFYDTSLKGHTEETAEQLAEKLGVKVPKKK
jgi:hypothetical protein